MEDVLYNLKCIDEIALPDDMLGLIKEYYKPVVPFKEELLNRKFQTYHLYPIKNLYRLYTDNSLLITEDLDFRRFYNRGYVNYNRHSMFNITGAVYLEYDREDVINIIKRNGTIENLNKLTNDRYFKPLDDLTELEVTEFAMWYVMEYD